MLILGRRYNDAMDVMIALGPEFHAEIVEAGPLLRRELITQHIPLYSDGMWEQITLWSPIAFKQRPYLAILDEERRLLFDISKSAVSVAAVTEASLAEPVYKEIKL